MKRTVRTAAILLALVAAGASADTVVCIVEAPTHDMPGPRLDLQLIHPIDPLPFPGLVQIPIPPFVTPQQKRNTCVTTLQGLGVPAAPLPAPNAFAIDSLPPGTFVTLFDQGTAEGQDQLHTPLIEIATIGFPGMFQPLDYDGLPAIFTAGIVTDVGEFVVGVSSDELMFQTDGPIICQALFQRLQPILPPPVVIVVNFDHLQFQINPTITTVEGGIVFGTTSPTPGVFGQIQIPDPPLLGDMNCDGVLDFMDIDPFVLAVSNPDEFLRQYPDCDLNNGDMNGDGQVNGLDINQFVEVLAGG